MQSIWVPKNSNLFFDKYHRQQYPLQVFEQFGALYMRNHHDKHLYRPVFELQLVFSNIILNTINTIGQYLLVYVGVADDTVQSYKQPWIRKNLN